MKFLDKLERKYGRYAISNLMVYIVAANAVVFAMMFVDPTGRLVSRLILVPALVMDGQWWRLITYVFIPPTTSILWVFFILYFYYIVGTGLEHEWGTFKFNAYYFLGYLGTTAAAVLSGGSTTALYLNLSLFLAFARVYPNYEILLFLIIPVKVKYIAWVNLAFLGLSFFGGNLTTKAVIIVSLANYILFFGKDTWISASRAVLAYKNRAEFQSQLVREGTIHRCTVCGLTEKDDPMMEFRYCAECSGDYEYCMEHLKSHEHVK